MYRGEEDKIGDLGEREDMSAALTGMGAVELEWSLLVVSPELLCLVTLS